MHNFKEVYKYSQNLNILYVEDDLDMLESTQYMFENFFYSVDTAVDGVDGLEKYIAFKNKTSGFYDLVVTDINMPRKNGLEMIDDIKAINSEQAVIVISAYNDSDRLIDLIRKGISNFITKPIMPNQLMQVIYKVSQSIYSEKMKNELLIGQSKLASMGEMIDTIAHQWQSPINLIKMQAQLLEMDLDEGMLEKKDIKECIDKQTLQINHIVETLNEFRSFFRPSEKLIIVSCKEMVDSTLILLKDKLIKHAVDVELNIAQSCNIEVITGEFKHVLINIITNAVDEFENKKIPNPKLIINSYEEDDIVTLEILDNAGGIPDDIIGEIFKVNFTTKKDSKGTGIGLYLVLLILEKINAKIDVKNLLNGVRFSIKLKKVRV